MQMKGKINIVGPLILLLALLIYAFSQGVWVGLNLLGDIFNIFGTVFIWLLNFIFSIPEVAQEIVKRILTTLLVWDFFGFSLYKSEEKFAYGVMGAVASVLCTILSWLGMF